MTEGEDNLRQRLINAKLAGSHDALGYRFNTNESAAAEALWVVAAWLRRKAYKQRANGQLVNVVTHRERCEEAAKRYENLAKEMLGLDDPRPASMLRDVEFDTQEETTKLGRLSGDRAEG